MRFSVYVTAEGGSFDPWEFNQNLPLKIRGDVRERQYMSARPGGAERTYWQSIRIDREQNPEEAFSEIIPDLAGPLRTAVDACSAKVSAHMVVFHHPQDDARGFYFSSDVVTMLAELRADLDIDVVPDLQR